MTRTNGARRAARRKARAPHVEELDRRAEPRRRLRSKIFARGKRARPSPSEIGEAVAVTRVEKIDLARAHDGLNVAAAAFQQKPIAFLATRERHRPLRQAELVPFLASDDRIERVVAQENDMIFHGAFRPR